MMTSAQVVETLVTTTDNSRSQDYTHPDDQTTLLNVTPGFKPLTVLIWSGMNHYTLNVWSRGKQFCFPESLDVSRDEARILRTRGQQLGKCILVGKHLNLIRGT